jgi:hypothetical protein
MNYSRRNVIAVVGLLFLAIAYLWSSVDAPVIAMDEGMLLAYPEQLVKGRLPYRDFESYYAPGNLFALLGAYELFGFDIVVERAVGLLYRLAILAGIFTIARRWSLTLAVAATILSLIIIKVTQLMAFAWWGGVACALWSIVFLAKVELRWRVGVAGILAGLAVLYRQDLGPAVVLATLPLWLRLGGRDRIKYLGFAIVALAPLIWITISAGTRATLDNLFAYPVFIAGPARRLPINSAAPVMLCLLGMHLLSVALNILASLLAVRERRDNANARLFLGTALLGLAITPQGLQRFDIVHLSFAASCSIPLLPLSINLLLGRVSKAYVPPLAEGAPVATVFGVMIAVYAMSPSIQRLYRVSAKAFTLPLDIRGREVPMPSLATLRSVSRVGGIMERNSRPGERVFVGPGDLRRTVMGDTYLYHLLPWLTPGSYFMEMNPSSANRIGSRLADDIAGSDWLILNRDYDNLIEPNASGSLGPDDPNEIVRTRFTLRAEVGSLLVYERSSRVKLGSSRENAATDDSLVANPGR